MSEDAKRYDSGSDKGNGDGSDSGSGSGSGANGSGGSVDGNGGNVSGNGGNVSGSAGGSIDGSAAGFSSADVVGNKFDTSGNKSDVANATASGGSPRGFGSAVADRIADSESIGGDSADRTAQRDNEVSFGLGKKQRGRPKGSTNRDSARTVSIKESKDLVSVFVGSLFDIPAILLKADFWRLSREENAVLTDAIIAWIDSLPKAQGNKFAKWISENMPMLNFAMVALFIVGDRVKKTFELTKGQAAQVQKFEQQSAQPSNIISTPLDAQMAGNFH